MTAPPSSTGPGAMTTALHTWAIASTASASTPRLKATRPPNAETGTETRARRYASAITPSARAEWRRPSVVHLTGRRVRRKHLHVLDQHPTDHPEQKDHEADDRQHDARGGRKRNRGEAEKQGADAEDDRVDAARKEVDAQILEIGEQAAYELLRKSEMDRKLKLAEVAKRLVDSADLLGA